MMVIVLINWLAGYALQRVGPGVLPWLRYDLTATRAHSLSPQSRGVLSEVAPGTELIGLFSVNDAARQSVADLLNVYDRQSAALSVSMIDPQRDAVARAALYERLTGRFAEELAPTRQGVESGRSALVSLNQGLRAEADTLGLLADEVLAMDEEQAGVGVDRASVAENLRVAQGVLSGMVGSLGQVQGVIDDALRGPMVPWGAARNDLVKVLRQARGEVILPVSSAFEDQAKRRGVPARVANQLLLAAQRLRELDRTNASALVALEQVGSVAGYERMTASLRGREAVIVASAGDVRVIGLDEMFGQEAAAGDTTARAAAAYRFLGEERITGALVMLSLAQPVRVVFVSIGQQPAFGQGGIVNAAAERLQSAGFELAQWQVLANQGGAVTPMPAARPNQRTVWIVLPTDITRPGVQPAQEQVALALAGARRAGDGVLLNFGFQRDSAYTAKDPLVVLAETMGITPQLGRIVLRPGTDARGNRSNSTVMSTRRWSDDTALGQTMTGRNVLWGMSSPLSIGNQSPSPQVLANVGGDDAWVERDPLLGAGLRAATPDDSERADALQGVAVAAVIDDAVMGRALVVTDGTWLRDEVLSSMQAMGNAELVLNSAFWLAKLDSAVGVSARSEALGLIGPMTTSHRSAYQMLLLAGVPTMALLTGILVWWRRRQG
jgi:hypothetical protein